MKVNLIGAEDFWGVGEYYTSIATHFATKTRWIDGNGFAGSNSAPWGSFGLAITHTVDD